MGAPKSELDRVVELALEQEQDPAQELERVAPVRGQEPRVRGVVLIRRRLQALLQVRVEALAQGPRALLDRALVYRSPADQVATEIL